MKPGTTKPAEWTPDALRVVAHAPEDTPAASALATTLDLPLGLADEVSGSTTAEPTGNVWQLRVDGEQRTLCRPDGARLDLDFTAGKARRRSREPGLARLPLLRAIGAASLQRRHGRLPHVIDATAGLGQDGWLFASTGLSVTLIERSALLHALLDHALTQAGEHPSTTSIAGRMTLERGDAIHWLPRHPGDVVYLDPMYPARRKPARVNKGMQFLQGLLGPADDADDRLLLEAALASARWRVVVKRPRHAPPLASAATGLHQRTCIASDATRYDIYHVSRENSETARVSPDPPPSATP